MSTRESSGPPSKARVTLRQHQATPSAGAHPPKAHRQARPWARSPRPRKSLRCPVPAPHHRTAVETEARVPARVVARRMRHPPCCTSPPARILIQAADVTLQLVQTPHLPFPWAPNPLRSPQPDARRLQQRWYRIYAPVASPCALHARRVGVRCRPMDASPFRLPSFCATHSRGRFFGHKFTSNSRLSTRPRSLPRPQTSQTGSNICKLRP